MRWVFVSYVWIEYPVIRSSLNEVSVCIICTDWVHSDWVQSSMRWVFVSYVWIEYPVIRSSRQWGECLYHMYGLSTQWLGPVVNEVSVCIICMDWVPSDKVQSSMRWVFVSYVRIEFPVTRCSRQWGECLYHMYGLSTQWLGAVVNEVSVYIICTDWVPSD